MRREHLARRRASRQTNLKSLEEALARFADVVARDLGCDFREAAGAGAAGGLGFGLMSFCGATIRPGFDLVAEMLDLGAAIQRADVVITGEGSLDEQTLEGKAPAGVARLARRWGSAFMRSWDAAASRRPCGTSSTTFTSSRETPLPHRNR